MVSTYSPGKYQAKVSVGGANVNVSIGGSGGGVTEEETITISNKPAVTETSTLGLGKPTGTVTSTIGGGQSFGRSTTLTAGADADGGVKSVAAALLQSYDKKNTGALENAQLGDIIKDVYKILGETYFPKPEDIEGMARVLDVNKDGVVTSDDLEAICKKFLGGPRGGSAVSAVKKHGEQEKRAGIRDDDEEKPPEVEFARQIMDGKAIFNKFDADKSGFLEEDEIPAVLEETYKKIGVKKTVNPKDVQTYMKTLDHNQDGKISMDEFIKCLVDTLVKDKQKLKPTGVSYSQGGYQKVVIKTEMEKAREIFDRHDADKSGFLESHEIPAVLKEMLASINVKREINESDVRAYLKTFDKNYDDKISFQEFTRLIEAAKKV